MFVSTTILGSLAIKSSLQLFELFRSGNTLHLFSELHHRLNRPLRPRFASALVLCGRNDDCDRVAFFLNEHSLLAYNLEQIGGRVDEFFLRNSARHFTRILPHSAHIQRIAIE
jgi:hypothetical protein